MNVLVVPTIREDYIKRFLRAWSGADFHKIIVVEDNKGKTFDLDGFANVRHYAWEDIDYELGRRSWIIPRKTDCIRSYGFLKAADMGADYIFTLDDDCFPAPEGASPELFAEDHIRYMEEPARVRAWRPTFTSDEGLFPRGLPFDEYANTRHMISVGLWEGIPDVGAVETIAAHRSGKFMTYKVEHCGGTAGYGVYIPMCGMNLCFRKEVLPLMYFPLMGNIRWASDKDEMQKLPFDRYGDIWAGVLAKRALDHLRIGSIRYGYPFVHHARASDPYTNLSKEANGFGVHEMFWRRIDSTRMEGSTPESAYLHLARIVGGTAPKLYDESDLMYWQNLGNAMTEWVSICWGDM